jgi:hypothetical protein
MLHPQAQQKPVLIKTSKSELVQKAQTGLHKPWISSISNQPLPYWFCNNLCKLSYLLG